MFEQLSVLSQLPPWAVGLTLLPLGLIFGSFSTVLVHRLPQHQSIVAPRSRCPECGHTLGPAELVPVVSFLWQRGKCRACQVPISWRYPLLELGCGLWTATAGVWGGWIPGLVAVAVWVALAGVLGTRGWWLNRRGQMGSIFVDVLIAVALLSLAAISMIPSSGAVTVTKG